MAEDIAFHEAVPGHHFQLTIAMESKDLAPARQVLFDTACAEGWGLYSERLADEMGLYSDDLARMGLFAADSWRASRLVVDTGLHAMGWTRQEAVDWMAEHTPLPRLEIETEIDRYISFPGQALAYMVGRREIVRLRTGASERLGARFDLRDFHDLVLRVGILPLPALARTVERWVLSARLVGHAGDPAAPVPTSGTGRNGITREAARPARTTPKRHTAVAWIAVHHRQMAPIRKSSTYTR